MLAPAKIPAAPAGALSDPPRYRPLGRRPALDGLRGIALLVVLGTHFFHDYFRGGAVGVDLFFVLSGFLITSLLLTEWERYGNISLRAFWMRRALRLFPALMLFLPVASAAAIFVGDSEDVVERSIFSATFYFMNFLQAADEKVASTLSHTWSLSVEEQFYVVWPLLFVLVMSRTRKPAVLIACAAAPLIAFPVWRTMLLLDGATYNRIKVGPDTRLDMLAIGCLVAVLWSLDLAPRLLTLARWLLWPAVAFLVGVVYYGGPKWIDHLAVWGWSAIGLAGSVLVLNAVDTDRKRLVGALSWGPLTWLGRRSYGIYLWHFMVLVLATVWLPGAEEITIALVAIPASLMLAALSWRYVEAPFLDLKKTLAAR